MLQIGLTGFIGSGKDTVAKMLNIILNYDWTDKEECKKFYNQYFNQNRYATFKENPTTDGYCTCIAFADQLKRICSVIFGIPIDRFYYNKNSGWICINKDFHYTETEPNEEYVITAEQFHLDKDNYNHSNGKYYMSLREVLIYVGTYVCQYNINNNIFVNIVNNCLKQRIHNNPKLKYVICTDVRFPHEYDYIRAKNGIMIKIKRNVINQDANIAEHSLDYYDDEQYDYVIENSGTYDDLFDTVWDLVQNNVEFQNYIVHLSSRDESVNYLRKVDDNKYKLCAESGFVRISHNSDGTIFAVDPAGGPRICVGETIEGTYITPALIIYDDINNQYYIES